MLAIGILCALLFLLASSQAQDIQCHEAGFCNGLLIGAIVAGSTNECHEACRNTAGCLWFTYNAADSFCGLYVDCEFDALECQCLTGRINNNS